MCGIAGIIDFNKKSTLVDLSKMVRSINHRGPDDNGVELIENEYAQIGLGQARLSIIDLSHGGHQPMTYKNYKIVFNGEIYNYKEIRTELINLGHTFISESDTEVILHSFEAWGIESVSKFIGMFAFVIFDATANNITIFRDRAGVKPFYYYWNKGLFLFASELKAFHENNSFEKVIDKKSVQQYFSQINHGYISAPHTIFENTYKLESGHFLRIDLKTRNIENKSYWDVLSYYKLPKLEISYDEAKIEVNNLLNSACEYRMVADVPVGVFLSGGYDSTAVTSILQSNRSSKIKTFTIGFEEGNNEIPYAKETAEILGTDHHDYICTTKEAQEIIPTLPYFYDEPYADSSAIPTILVSKHARKSVTVALSADAGDEVFCGYNSYLKLDSYLNKLDSVPDFFKPAVRNLGLLASTLLPQNQERLKHKMGGFAHAMQQDKILQSFDLLKHMNDLPKSYQSLFPSFNADAYSTNKNEFIGFSNPIEVAMALDYKNYLQDDILTKVDRATMSVSLEGREPLLDHRIVEFLAQLPIDYKLHNNIGKRILKDIVHQYVPKEKMDRPKTGFSLPIYSWLKHDLSFLLDEYLNEKAIAESGLFNVDFILSKVKDFKNGKLHYTPFLWKILMFQMWYNKWMR